jgi:hypothetical protein
MSPCNSAQENTEYRVVVNTGTNKNEINSSVNRTDNRISLYHFIRHVNRQNTVMNGVRENVSATHRRNTSSHVNRGRQGPRNSQRMNKGIKTRTGAETGGHIVNATENTRAMTQVPLLIPSRDRCEESRMARSRANAH